MKTRIYSIICVICLLFSSVFALTSCNSDNAVGIVSAEINENGELVLVYSDGNEQNLGVVVGKDGEDGEKGSDGSDGKDGTNGQNGINGANGADGSLIITSDGSSIPAASAKGLRSAVSIVCNFQSTIQQGGWRPGSSSTTTQDYSSAGSGVIYQMDKAEGDAFIITNYHVVYDASSNTENGISDDISVYLYGSEIEEKAIEATYVGGSLYYDIAVLQIDNSDILKASDACEVDVADSDAIVVGDTAYKPKIRKSGTGCVTMINDHLYEGRFTPRVNGKRISKNVYAKTREECEEKLAELIKTMKAEIAEMKKQAKNA